MDAMTPSQKADLEALFAKWDERDGRYGSRKRPPMSKAELAAAKLYRLSETADLRGLAHTIAVMRIKDWGG